MRRACLLPLLICCIAAAPPQISIVRIPDKGLEPQAKVDAHGNVHLIYFHGDAKAGDVFYCTSGDGGQTFSKPLRVNSTPSAALILGAVRGPRLALDKNDRPLVIFTGSDAAQPQPRLAGLRCCFRA